MENSCDAIVIGSGPNGLSAAITLARVGKSVVIYEARETIGGAVRSSELTLPGFLHDHCSAVYPLGIASPFFQTLPLSDHGLQWIHSPAPLAHPFDDGDTLLLERSLDTTGSALGPDERAYLRLMGPLLKNWDDLKKDLLGPPRWPKHPGLFAQFGLRALWPASLLARRLFRRSKTRALFAGICAHSELPLKWPISSAVGLVLGVAAHGEGWPIVKGGASSLSKALASYFLSLGGNIITNSPIESLEQLPRSRAVLFDLSPRQVLKIAGPCFTPSYAKKLTSFRYGPGVFKLDWALDGPIPWKNAACAHAATVHLGGSLDEISRSEYACWHQDHADKPFVLVTQPSLFDSTRAPVGKHTAWAYCHVPNGSKTEQTERIESQMERFAPGFRDRILARSVLNPARLEKDNPNLIGGDIGGGASTLSQLFIRPARHLYSTSVKEFYICSASTPPGGGVHGLCGYFAAQAALKTSLR